MKRAHPLSHWTYGRIYSQTVPASSRSNGWLWWWIPSFWIGSSAMNGGKARDGIDGEGESALYGETSINVNGSGARWKSFFPWLASSNPSSGGTLNRASNKP